MNLGKAKPDYGHTTIGKSIYGAIKIIFGGQNL